jgi:hypothetical protein
MTTKQKNLLKEELYSHLDYEYDDLSTINRMIKASEKVNLSVHNMLFCYAMGILTTHVEIAIMHLFDEKRFKNKTILDIKGEVALQWTDDFMIKMDK